MAEVVAKVRVDRGEVRHAVIHAGGVAVRVERLGQAVRVVVATGAVTPTWGAVGETSDKSDIEVSGLIIFISKAALCTTYFPAGSPTAP